MARKVSMVGKGVQARAGSSLIAAFEVRGFKGVFTVDFTMLRTGLCI